MIRGWAARYSGIAREFGLSRRRDAEAAAMLDCMISRPVPVGAIGAMLRGRTVFVIGSGHSLLSLLPVLREHPRVARIAADSSVRVLLEGRIRPDIVVTDLDGHAESLEKTARTGSIMLVHAHGDNMKRLHMAKKFKNCLGTTQAKETGRLRNFGGFTDGDRCVFMADALGAKKIILVGMDLQGRIGGPSDTAPSDRATKRAKLRRARALLEWLATKSRCELYTMSSPIAGFEKISRRDVGGIVV